MELLPLALATPVLLGIAWTDFRITRIRNLEVLANLLLMSTKIWPSFVYAWNVQSSDHFDSRFTLLPELVI